MTEPNKTCEHRWQVTEWLVFADTARTFEASTNYKPMVSNVTRQKAMAWGCPLCGTAKRVDDPEAPDCPEPSEADKRRQ